MKSVSIVLALAIASLIVPSSSSAASGAVSVPVSSILGSWAGPFLGLTWTFEFSQDGDKLAGRYKTSKANKWASIDDITYVDGIVKFSFESQPPSNFHLEMEPAGKAMTGSAKIGELRPIPLTLTRGS